MACREYQAEQIVTHRIVEHGIRVSRGLFELVFDLARQFAFLAPMQGVAS
jgi:hypothetical protein